MSLTTAMYRRPARLNCRPVTALLAAAAIFCVAGGTTADALPSPVPHPAVTNAALGQRLVTLPGVHTSSVDLTLLTGERIRLQHSAGGPFVAIQLANAPDWTPATPVLVIHTSQPSTHAALTMLAAPAPEAALIASGRLDPHLFDLAYLAAHANGTAPSREAVTVHFTTATTAAAVQAKVQAIPGATLRPGSATAQQATVDVSLGTQKFWKAITRTAPFDPATRAGRVWNHNPAAPLQFRDGISALTAPDQAPVNRPALTVATYPLTVRLHAFTNPALANSPQLPAVYANSYLYGITGPEAGQGVFPTSVACDSDTKCDTIDVTFETPAGNYQFGGQEEVWGTDDRYTSAFSYRPDLAVAAPTTMDIHLDDSSFLNAKTSRPSENVYSAVTITRRLPDGTRGADLIDGVGPGFQRGFWFTRTAPVIHGAFSFVSNSIWQQPMVSMAINRPARSSVPALHPEYQAQTGSYDEFVGQYSAIPFNRFPAGTRSYRVRDVGMGTFVNFTRANFAGALVIVHPNPAAGSYTCNPQDDVLRRALNAGAAGVVFDSTDPRPTTNHNCLLPIYAIASTNTAEPAIPWASIRPGEAHALERLVAHHAVTIRVTSTDRPSYTYDGNIQYASAIPADLDVDLVHARLHAQIDHLHVTSRQVVTMEHTTFNADTVGSAGAILALRPSRPVTMTEYFGPVDPDVTWSHWWQRDDANDGSQQSLTLNTQTKPQTVEYFETPSAPGAPNVSPDVTAVSPGSPTVCDFCRQGNVFYPFFDEINGASPQLIHGPFYYPTATLTDSTGKLIPVNGGIPAYTLPAGQQKYTFASHSPDADNSWTFTSSKPLKNTAPKQAWCVGKLVNISDAPCAALPFVFLRYKAPVDHHNQSPAGTTQTLALVAYHQSLRAPSIESVKLAVSVNGGATWKTAPLVRTSAGHYRARIAVPALRDTDGYVSLRATALDRGGNTLHQTLYDAYALRAQ